MSEWVNVSDRLPRIGENVLTLCKHGVIEGRYEVENNLPMPSGYLIFTNYYWEDMEWLATYWMSLPSPPKESNDA